MTDKEKAAAAKKKKEKATAAKAKADKQVEENKYVDSAATTKTVADLTAFKKTDTQKWDRTKKGEKRRVSKGGNISFGGSKLGSSNTRKLRKKNNRNT
tara:strand:+ start:38348 stop:38641 length:294 start_codon:yes stop_codon:yes gene_type:complete